MYGRLGQDKDTGNDVMRIWLYRLVFVIASFSRVACGLLSVYPHWKHEVRMASASALSAAGGFRRVLSSFNVIM